MREEDIVPTISEEDLRSWHDMIDFYQREGTRRERRLAKALCKATSWIEPLLDIENEAAHLAQWTPQEDGVYRLICMVCGKEFGECYAPGSFEAFYLRQDMPCRR